MTIPVTDKNYPMDKGLSQVLDSIAYNLPNDWDSVLLIAGDGQVRVGKSVLAQQVGYYLAWKLKTPFTVKNICFTGTDLMERARTFPRNSIFIYDEARESLNTKMVMEQMTKTLLNFFSECGAYGHAIIIVLPDFFDLPKGIAIQRSELLLNVYRDVSPRKDSEGKDVVKYERGFFDGYHRVSKAKLYMLGKKDFNNYQAVKRDFFGEFFNHYTVPKEDYLAAKLEHIGRDRLADDKEARFDAALYILSKYLSLRDMEKALKDVGVRLSFESIRRHIEKFSKESS